MTTEPTDAELWQFYMTLPGASPTGHPDPIATMRAALRSWGQPSGAGEVVYQASHKDGFWQDCSRERCEYLQNPENTCAEDWETRILYTRPPTSAEGVDHG